MRYRGTYADGGVGYWQFTTDGATWTYHRLPPHTHHPTTTRTPHLHTTTLRRTGHLPLRRRFTLPTCRACWFPDADGCTRFGGLAWTVLHTTHTTPADGFTHLRTHRTRRVLAPLLPLRAGRCLPVPPTNGRTPRWVGRWFVGWIPGSTDCAYTVLNADCSGDNVPNIPGVPDDLLTYA